MDHHTSWFSFFPGFHNLQSYVQHAPQLVPAEHAAVQHVYAAILVVIALFVMGIIVRGRMADVEKAIIPPTSFGVVALFEIIFDMFAGMGKMVVGHEYRRYLPVVGSLGLFILFSNLLGLIPGFVPPTDNLNTTLVCGVIIFLYFNFHALRVNGIHHLIHLANPVGETWGWILMPLMLPIELISLCVRPVSLALRLAGNMIGDHSVLFAFAGLMPLLVPLPFQVLGLLVCVVQTVVFCLLSFVYISLHATEAEHH